MTTTTPIHPYAAIGGGQGGKVHGPGYIPRREFYVALPQDQRRYANLSETKVYYSRLWGGEFRERRKEEEPPRGGKKVILCQGLGGTSVNWAPQLRFFSQDASYDVVALDLRGVGHSESPSGRWKTSELGRELNELVETELGWKKAHLVGFSLGGMASLEACLHRPDLYKSVTLISTHAGGLMGTMLPPWGVVPFLKTFGDLENVTSVDAGIELLFPTSYLDSDVVEEELQDEEEEHEALFREAAGKCLGSNDRVTNRFKQAWDLILQARKYVEAGLEPIRLEGTLKQISAAITHHVGWDRLFFLKVSDISFLVIHGVHDNLVNYANANMLAEALNAPLLLKEDAGHGLQIQHHKEVNQAIANLIHEAENRTPLEGKRAKTSKDGYAPGQHPWLTFAQAFFPCFLLARRISESRKFTITLLLVACLLRLRHGSLFRVPFSSSPPVKLRT